jgi:hypothetical protein
MSFIPGLTLSKMFYHEIVGPILKARFPSLPYSAGLIGSGSEVLGFDDEMSTDHHWGPRLMLFLEEEDVDRLAEAIRKTLAEELPYEFHGYPTNFSEPNLHPTDRGTQLLQPIEEGPVNHRVSVYSVQGFFMEYMGLDISKHLDPADWLSLPEQKLRAVTAGAVFHDAAGLENMRKRLVYYPRDVWLYLLAAGWGRIEQEEHLMGRAGLVGDEVGSALIGARLVRDVMRLCFLMQRTYATYPKWFGTAFKQLSCAADLWPVLQSALWSETWQTRQKYLIQAFEYIAAMHNQLEITEPLPEKAIAFHNRPFQVVAFQGFHQALLKEIKDPRVRQIASRPLIGGIDQFSDSTDLLSKPGWRKSIKRLYNGETV